MAWLNNLFAYMVAICFISNVLLDGHFSLAQAKQIKANYSYDLLDDKLDYPWMIGEDQVVVRMEVAFDKDFEGWWRAAGKALDKTMAAKKQNITNYFDKLTTDYYSRLKKNVTKLDKDLKISAKQEGGKVDIILGRRKRTLSRTMATDR